MAVVEQRAGTTEGEAGLLLWLLVFSELAAFSILIVGCLILSVRQPDAFAAARAHLGTGLASFNTLVLLTSGWQAAEAVRSPHESARSRHLVAAAALGFLFVFIKLLEYRVELPFTGDETLSSFFEIYFLATGFHLLHVVFLGFLMLLVARRPKGPNVALLATLWHVVDLVWLVLFPVLYLV